MMTSPSSLGPSSGSSRPSRVAPRIVRIYTLSLSLRILAAIIYWQIRGAAGAFVALKENIRVDGKRDIQTKVMTTLFALFAEVERDLISERTCEGLAKARSSGRKLGRPKGSLGVSRLNGKEVSRAE